MSLEQIDKKTIVYLPWIRTALLFRVCSYTHSVYKLLVTTSIDWRRSSAYYRIDALIGKSYLLRESISVTWRGKTVRYIHTRGWGDEIAAASAGTDADWGDHTPHRQKRHPTGTFDPRRFFSNRRISGFCISSSAFCTVKRPVDCASDRKCAVVCTVLQTVAHCTKFVWRIGITRANAFWTLCRMSSVQLAYSRTQREGTNKERMISPQEGQVNGEKWKEGREGKVRCPHSDFSKSASPCGVREMPRWADRRRRWRRDPYEMISIYSINDARNDAQRWRHSPLQLRRCAHASYIQTTSHRKLNQFGACVLHVEDETHADHRLHGNLASRRPAPFRCLT